MSTVALIPLRGGSKGIPGKNIKTIAGRPLCGWVIDAALKARQIDVCYVSTDCPKIKAVVKSLAPEVRIIDRPSEFATDQASTESVMLHFASSVPFSTLVTIQATSPLLLAQDLDAALESYRSKGYDSMLSVVRERRFFWNEDGTPLNYDPRCRPRRQEFQGVLKENGAFYITSRDVLETEHCRLGGWVGLYEMPEDTACEIDEPEDWDLVERLLQMRSEMQ